MNKANIFISEKYYSQLFNFLYMCKSTLENLNFYTNKDLYNGDTYKFTLTSTSMRTIKELIDNIRKQIPIIEMEEIPS